MRRFALLFLIALLLGPMAPCVAAGFAHPVVYLTPKIEGAHRYPPAERAARLAGLLETLEPGGPAGRVQIGYTLPMTLLNAFRRDASGAWRIDLRTFEEDLAIAAEIGRPIIIALYSSHFVEGLGSGTLGDELVADSRNLMAYEDGRPALDRYFSASIVGYTLSTDPDIPVNAWRRRAMIAALERIRTFRNAHPNLLVGVELIGEAHHLFPDLRHGNDRFRDIRTTDYSAASRRDFRAWLRDEGWTLEALNRHIGAHFTAWEDVLPPGFAGADPRPWTHWDAFAAGDFPVAGWVDHRDGVAGVTLVLDGETEIPATTQLSRTDVYDALPDIDTATSGFRGTIDLEGLAPGWHGVTVRATLPDGQSGDLGHKVFFVGSEAEMAETPPPGMPALQPRPPGLRGNVDDPEQIFAVQYNPFAALWHAFRQSQIVDHFKTWIELAEDSGLPPELVYTYQVAPFLVGGWNDMLYAIGDDFFSLPGARPGITAYGGTVDSPRLFELMAGRPYAITEFHPLRPRHPAAAEAAMRRHFAAGAVFIAPFFLSLIPQDLGQRDFEMFLIRPDNPNRGSDHLYRAIRLLAAE